MKFVKIFVIVVAVVVLLLVILFGIFLLTHRQGVIESSEIINPEASSAVLIASQGSAFKNQLVDSITTRLKGRSISVKVVDVTTLDEVNYADFDACIVIHTTEKWMLQPDVKKFLDRAKDAEKILLITTSGRGDWKAKDYPVDVITSASSSSEFRVLSGQIMRWLDAILGNDPE